MYSIVIYVGLVQYMACAVHVGLRSDRSGRSKNTGGDLNSENGV